MTIQRENTNLRTIIIAILVFGLGLALLYAADNWIISSPSFQTVVRNLGGLLIATVTVTILWELAAKRAFVSELMATARLAEDVRSAGISKIPGDFLKEIDWAEWLGKVHKLDILFVYGRTWRGMHDHELRALAARKGARVRIVLPDPEDEIIVSELARRNDTKPEIVRQEITQAAADFISIFTKTPRAAADFSLWYLSMCPTFSFFRLDRTAVIALYKHSKGRDYTPHFVVQDGGKIYSFIRQEFDAIISEDKGLARKVYP